MTDPVASTVSFAKSPAASFIALFAGIIGLLVFGDDQSEIVRGTTFLLLTLGGAGAMVHGFVAARRFLFSAAIQKTFQNRKYRSLTRRMCEKQLFIFHECLLHDVEYFPPPRSRITVTLNSSEQWIQDLLERELVTFYAGDSSSRPFIAVVDDYWEWLRRNRSFLKKRIDNAGVQTRIAPQ